MMKTEFEKITGFFPSDEMYKVIEQEYMDSALEKKEFCSAYVKNKDGIAEKIQRTVDAKRMKDVALYEGRIAVLEDQLKSCQRKLEVEEEWRICESPLISAIWERSEYLLLAENKCCEVMTDERAKEFIEKTFGFSKQAIHIIRCITPMEKNRHGKVRPLQSKDRVINTEPLYAATDWNYVLFQCCGYTYECINGELDILHI